MRVVLASTGVSSTELATEAIARAWAPHDKRDRIVMASLLNYQPHHHPVSPGPLARRSRSLAGKLVSPIAESKALNGEVDRSVMS